MSYTVIIPARFASSRLPGKPLMDIAGKPMIQHVWERARESDAARVVVATEDQRVFDACQGFGADVVMTLASHESGTDRLQEVVAKLGLADDEIVVNVQGDEPLIPREAIAQVANNLALNAQAGIATLAEAIHDKATVFNPNAVKAVSDLAGFALYFSRAPMPWCRDEWASAGSSQEGELPAGAPFLRHIGIYAYRVGFLHQFVTWPMGVLERVEKLEQLRAMENGVRIHIELACVDIPGGVDTEADLNAVRAFLMGKGA
ncbi:3-deoxy-manno-octulosonate cytidylyltransferase [uncultured Zhongshania sp.]|jgi:3-deoxy-manno-octulosonate cytidylyltransferase (CMP-KDO synthetase)|uniref:3-deoxy-manno-octulosonate cytidylyltransferase n=1 Tax=uncultured Zhongshania sp. TaxID=1642288 RepID=UPI0025D4BF1A|nr:3-deoxy-manno-octulosonate cytidylyltransferase [uncultured Zhongshania sp.]|tara:strand:- start:3215 stop:3994 length:780 start_codon:yes stop_codon:yes gene_type:complete